MVRPINTKLISSLSIASPVREQKFARFMELEAREVYEHSVDLELQRLVRSVAIWTFILAHFRAQLLLLLLANEGFRREACELGNRSLGAQRDVLRRPEWLRHVHDSNPTIFPRRHCLRGRRAYSRSSRFRPPVAISSEDTSRGNRATTGRPPFSRSLDPSHGTPEENKIPFAPFVVVSLFVLQDR